MPCCGATFDENTVRPWIRGDSRGFWNAGTNHPGATRPLSLRDRWRSAPPLPRRGFSGELEEKTRKDSVSNKTSQRDSWSVLTSWFLLLPENLEVPLGLVRLSHFDEEARILITGVGVLRISLDGLFEIGKSLRQLIQGK